MKPADKEYCTVIIDKNDYVNEGLRQLSNTKHYKKRKPIHDKIKDKITEILDELYSQGFIDKNK